MVCKPCVVFLHLLWRLVLFVEYLSIGIDFLEYLIEVRCLVMRCVIDDNIIEAESLEEKPFSEALRVLKVHTLVEVNEYLVFVLLSHYRSPRRHLGKASETRHFN